MLAKKIIFCVFLFLLLLIIWGCPYGSAIPLGKIEKSVIDTNLLGSWKTGSTGVDSFEVMTIYPFNQHEYLILFQEKDEASVFRAFSTQVDDHTFLNVNELNPEIKHEPNYIFVEYLLTGDELKFRFIEDKVPQRNFKNSGAFYDFVKKNLDNNQLFGEYDTLIRVIE
jgi:hypothetical protein